MPCNMNPNQDCAHWLEHKHKSPPGNFDRNKFLAMDLGECFVDGPIERFAITNLNHYPHEQELLKASLASRYEVQPSMITLGNGSDEIIENIPQLCLDPGDAVVIVVPTFFRFIESSIKRRARIQFVNTKKEDNFCVTQETIQTLIQTANKDNAKLIWLCSPNNPTGIPIQTEYIEHVITQTNALVVVDQVYGELQHKASTEIISLTKTHANLIVLKSFSKVFGLAGIRVGFAIANPQIIDMLHRWHLIFNISHLSLTIAQQALQEKNRMEHIKEVVEREREFLFEQISLLRNLELMNKSETNIFLLRHKGKKLFEELLQKNILVANMENTRGLEGLHFARVTVGNHADNLLFLQALQAIN